MTLMSNQSINKWDSVPLVDAVDIFDSIRIPVNSKERQSRISGKPQAELYPYYGATGQVGFIDEYILDGEYVLLGEDGAPFLDSFSNKAYIISGKTWVNNHAHILRSKINNKFLCYYLNYFNYRGYVSGTTRLKLTQADMKRIPVPIPPPFVQEYTVSRIEELFSELDKAEEILQTIKQQLTVYRQAVLKEAFEAKESYQHVTLSEIAEIVGGVTKGRNLSGSDTIELPYLRVANVQDGYLDLNTIKTIEIKLSERDKYLLKQGDVLYTEGGDRDKLGRGTVWNEEISECIHQNHIFRARIDRNKTVPKYIALYSQSIMAKDYFYQKGKQTTNLASINMTILKALPVPLPSLIEQEKVLGIVESQLSICDKLEQLINENLAKAQAFRRSILKKAFSGKLVL